jgi:hypothetical protein
LIADRTTRLGLACLLIAAAWLFALPLRSVRAGTITVCASGCDYDTIQGAIDAASTDVRDIISVEDAVHTEAGIVVDKEVLIFGEGASSTIVQADDGPDTAVDRVFTIAPGVSVTIQDMTIRYGRAAGSPARGGGILNNGTLTLKRVAVRDNRAVGSEASPGGKAEGGGIFNDGSLTVVQSTVSGNEAQAGDGAYSGVDGGDGHGGGIANGEDGSLMVTNSTISGNSALPGEGRG